MSNPPEDRGTQLAQERTDLALQRTLIAAERTLMAWIRTSISLIGFGFSIYKFFEYLVQSESFRGTLRAQAPRHLGLALIGLGILALVGAVWHHQQFLAKLGVTDKSCRWSMAVLVAVLMALIGVLAFIGVLLKTGPF
jgi:putative membrane protein